MELVKIHDQHIPLGDGLRYVGTKEFVSRDQESSSTDATLIAALLSNPAFRDGMDTPTSERDTTDDRHGPYIASALRVRHYQAVTVDEAIRATRQFVTDTEYQPGKPEALGQVDALLERIAEDGWSAYSLEVQDDSALHELYFIHIDFREHLFVDAKGGRLLQLVQFVD